MRNLIYALVIGAILCGCGCNDSKKDEGSYFLTKDYDLVLGYAIPDEDRLVPTEVFVGRILDRVIETEVVGMQDSFLMEQIQHYHGWYQGQIIYHEDAEVTISSETQSIKLQHVGYGTYRDVNNELHVEPLKEYSLEVKRPGKRLYTSSVVVPGDFDVLNIHNWDTIGPIYPIKRTFENCYKILLTPWSISSRAFLYRMKAKDDVGYYSNLPDVKYASFVSDQGVVVFYKLSDPTDTIRRFQVEVLAFDTSASIFYQQEGLGLNPNVDSFLTYWNSGNIEKRSGLNTHGAKDAIGNFGAYNAARIHFWVKASKDSCGIDGPPY